MVTESARSAFRLVHRKKTGPCSSAIRTVLFIRFPFNPILSVDIFSYIHRRGHSFAVYIDPIGKRFLKFPVTLIRATIIGIAAQKITSEFAIVQRDLLFHDIHFRPVHVRGIDQKFRYTLDCHGYIPPC